MAPLYVPRTSSDSLAKLNAMQRTTLPLGVHWQIFVEK